MMAYDPSLYESRRRSLEQNYSAQGAMNAYANFLSQQRGQRNFADMQNQFTKAVPQLVSAYGRRGLNTPNVHSGIFNRGMADFSNQAIQQQSLAQEDMAQQQRQAELSQNALTGQYNQGLQDLEAEKARQIASDAAALLQFRAGA
jgi:hypothetical protein